MQITGKKEGRVFERFPAMDFVWEKKGLIFDPRGRTDWMCAYAQNPNVLELEDRLRIYFTCRPRRDSEGRCTAYTGFADFENEEPFNLIDVAERPVLDLGGPGDFDQFGVMPGSVLHNPDTSEVWMYYVGWSRMESVPYKWQSGLAISKDMGRSFERAGKGPILGPTLDDPYLQACPRVERRREKDWAMFYNAGVEWNLVEDHYESVYITRKAISEDGIHWDKQPGIALPRVVPQECQTSATWMELDGNYHMFFSYRYGVDFRNRDKGYRMGHAVSRDFTTWERADESVGIDVSADGWDSEMICYPHVVNLRGDWYMFYCGNYFGEGGFGYAKLADIK